MFGNFLRNRRQNRSENFIKSIPSFSNDGLKGAYSMLDMERQLHPRENTYRELSAVETELNKRGFEHMRDY